MQVRKPRRDDSIEVGLDGIDARGHAVGTAGEYRVRVRDATPGARITARVVRRRRNEIDAHQVDVLEPSPDGATPRCAHFASCGGCTLQDLSYPAQLRHLGDLLARTLAPLEPWLAGRARAGAEPVVGCDDPWHYRNKMDFTFGNRRWVEPGEPEDAERDFALGLHVPARFDKVLSVDHCDIAFREATGILRSARELARAAGLSAWDVREHRGLLRHLVLRKGVRTGELLAYLVTSEGDTAAVDAYAAAILARHPELTTFVHGVNPGVAQVAVASEQRVLHGTGRIEEELGGLRFSISPESFFQTNTVQAERLLGIVREEAALEPDDVLFDLYCGGGALALGLAATGDGREVWGFELVESAIADARDNARRNGVERARFVAGDLAATVAAEALAERGAPEPTVCVVDPPRAGMHPSVVAALARLAPRRVVHVSCNPKTAARDLALLCAEGYAVERIRPIDLFPHTAHLECVFTLERTTPSA